MLHRPLIYVYALLYFAWGCGNEERASVPEAGAPVAIYADYRVWASEGDSMATCMVQFFTGPQKRQSLWLDAPAAIQVDEVLLEGDSARYTGAYYEYQEALSGFAGKHAITFNNGDGKTFRDSFFFPVFTLATELPEVVRGSLSELRLAGIPEGASVRVVLTDTSFAGQEYNELHTVKSGAVQLDAASMAQLHRGPVVLHLTAEEERPLRSALPGALSIGYSLTRAFQLD